MTAGAAFPSPAARWSLEKIDLAGHSVRFKGGGGGGGGGGVGAGVQNKSTFASLVPAQLAFDQAVLCLHALHLK